MPKRSLLLYALVALVATPTTIALEAYRSPYRGDFEGFRLAGLPRQQTPAAKGDRRPMDNHRAGQGSYLSALFNREAWFGGKFGAKAPSDEVKRRNVPVEEVCETIAASAQLAGLPVGFFARLIYQESSFRENLVSSAGAQGVAQFMPATAAELGLADPFDPIASLPVSAQFLRTHLRYFGNLGLAAAAYNAGAKRVEDWLARRSSLPSETRNYVVKITGHQPEKWIEPTTLDLPTNLPAYAPCEGVAGLSRARRTKKIEARLEPQIAMIVDEAKAVAAKAAAAKAAAAKAAKQARTRIGKAAKAAKEEKGKEKAKENVKPKQTDEARERTNAHGPRQRLLAKNLVAKNLLAKNKPDAKPARNDKLAAAER